MRHATNIFIGDIKMKWTEDKVKTVIQEAREAGRIAALEKLQELQKQGPQFAVTSGPTVVGTLLDVCGFASLKISARGKFYLLAKKLAKHHCFRFMCDRAYYGGGHLCIFDSTMRQELSINKAACQGQAEVLAKYGIESRIDSRID